jgi:hypothetical protein
MAAVCWRWRCQAVVVRRPAERCLVSWVGPNWKLPADLLDGPNDWPVVTSEKPLCGKLHALKVVRAKTVLSC